MNEILGFTIFILAFLLIATPIFILFNRRHLTTYDNQIKDYLNSKRLTFLNKSKPNTGDWKDGPFSRPPIVKAGIGQVRIGGMTMPMADSKYWVINTKEGEKVWLEINTMLFFKPELCFKIQRKPVKPRDELEYKTTESYKCPACGFLVLSTESECPDCGLALSIKNER